MADLCGHEEVTITKDDRRRVIIPQRFRKRLPMAKGLWLGLSPDYSSVYLLPSVERERRIAGLREQKLAEAQQGMDDEDRLADEMLRHYEEEFNPVTVQKSTFRIDLPEGLCKRVGITDQTKSVLVVGGGDKLIIRSAEAHEALREERRSRFAKRRGYLEEFR